MAKIEISLAVHAPFALSPSALLRTGLSKGRASAGFDKLSPNGARGIAAWPGLMR
jgi:hypothetical protein